MDGQHGILAAETDVGERAASTFLSGAGEHVFELVVGQTDANVVAPWGHGGRRPLRVRLLADVCRRPGPQEGERGRDFRDGLKAGRRAPRTPSWSMSP